MKTVPTEWNEAEGDSKCRIARKEKKRRRRKKSKRKEKEVKEKREIKILKDGAYQL